jgi:hypothetical protein
MKKSLCQIDQFAAAIKNTNIANIKIFAQNGFKPKAKQNGFFDFNVKSKRPGVKLDV